MNSHNTHGEIFIGEKFSMFIDGVPDKCEHDYTGDTISITRSGKYVYWHTYKQWASYTSQLRDRLVLEHQHKIDDPIVESAVSCRKCKKMFQPSAF